MRRESPREVQCNESSHVRPGSRGASRGAFVSAWVRSNKLLARELGSQGDGPRPAGLGPSDCTGVSSGHLSMPTPLVNLLQG